MQIGTTVPLISLLELRPLLSTFSNIPTARRQQAAARALNPAALEHRAILQAGMCLSPLSAPCQAHQGELPPCHGSLSWAPEPPGARLGVRAQLRNRGAGASGAGSREHNGKNQAGTHISKVSQCYKNRLSHLLTDCRFYRGWFFDFF